MKKILLSISLLTTFISFGQNDSLIQVDNTAGFKIPFLKVIGVNLISATSDTYSTFEDIPIGGNTPQLAPVEVGILEYQFEDFNIKAITPQIGRNFKGNQMQKFRTPPDNSMAISNNGFIVSFDNTTVEYRSENGDSVSLYIDLYTFIDSSTTTDLLFDPKVIYDNEADRFIAVLIHKDSLLSELLVAFSRTNTPTDGWNLYKFNADTLFPNSWFDRPNIGINSEDLFITGGIFPDVGTTLQGNITFQMEKERGYTDSSLVICKVWKDIRQPDGDLATGMHPMSYGQQGNYGAGIYMVSTDWQGGDNIYTHHFTKNCSQTPDTVITVAHPTTTYFEPPNSFQPASINLRTSNCRVMDGFFLNNRCHFVFNVSQNGYCAIRYQRVNVLNNTTVWDSRGLASSQSAYAFPTIASFGVDSTSNDVMIGYLRSSPLLNPSVAVLNYDGANWSGTTIVKEGLDTLDILSNIDYNYERWGDYISMQRRYNATTPTVWMMGHYGDTLNYWGQTHGWSSWIAEIGDTGVGIDENEVSFNEKSYVFPNPAQDLLYVMQNPLNPFIECNLYNLNGKLLLSKTEFLNEAIVLPMVNNGMYIVRLRTNDNQIRNEKIIINR